MNNITAQTLSRVQIKIRSCMEFNLDAQHRRLEHENSSGSVLSTNVPWFKDWELIRSGETATLTFENGNTLPVRIVQVVSQNSHIRLCFESKVNITSNHGAVHA